MTKQAGRQASFSKRNEPVAAMTRRVLFRIQTKGRKNKARRFRAETDCIVSYVDGKYVCMPVMEALDSFMAEYAIY